MSTVIAVVLALMSAVLAAVGTVMRHQATVRTGGIGRAWVLGAVVSVGAFALQAAALVMGEVLLVQPLIVLSVLFELFIQVWWTRRPATAWQWTCGAAVAVGVGIFVVFARPQPAVHGRQAWILDTVVIGFLLIVLTLYLTARRTRGNTSGLLFGLVAGSLFGLVAVQINSLSDPFRGLTQTLANPTLWICVLTGAAAIVAQQRAFGRGSLEVSYPAMVSAEPVVSMILSLAVLGEKLSSHSVGTYVGITGVAIMILGVVGLAQANAREERRAAAPRRVH
ncbi:DMT family transporter [Nakamurella flavida]|uniref:DMT family transporter n=1 Tax=Nakamurella flavida TaxID=363630 RepID=A0A939C3E6_9ACTN|nr:DMT family transporter [Nakamurella flavida]MBM9477555.1 DMT family transporter [Nakamurella flavida]MDP9779103.1 drug/metabolite transporter (DMT)-like permease [Nakamurella flavida]